MRDYSKAGPRFWTGTTGRYLREMGRDAQVLGFYLFTCPNSNMIGLYYLPMSTLVHETGIEKPLAEHVLELLGEGPSEGLGSPFEGVFARYDRTSETIFVTEMAHHQVGARLSKKDNRHKAVIRELEQYRKTPFFNDFLIRYAEPYGLDSIVPNKPLQRTLQAPSKPRAGAGARERAETRLSLGADPGESANGNPAAEETSDSSAPGEAWRAVEGCDAQAHETWLEYRIQAGDDPPPHVRLVNAKFLAGKGSPEAQRAFVDELIRLQFRRLHDPVHGNSKPAKEGAGARGLPIINP